MAVNRSTRTMARCDEGYRCEVCGKDVEAVTDSDLYLRYILGEVPLDMSLREGGDTGKPIVAADPAAPAAAVLLSIAGALAGRGRGLAGMQLGLTPAGRL